MVGHGQPLEGRARLGDEWRGIKRDTYAAAFTVESFFYRKCQGDNFLDIAVGLGGQADDEI